MLSDNDEGHHPLMFTLEGATYDAVFKRGSGNSFRSTMQQSRIISPYINQSYINVTLGENIPLPASDFAEKLDRIGEYQVITFIVIARFIYNSWFDIF